MVAERRRAGAVARAMRAFRFGQGAIGGEGLMIILIQVKYANADILLKRRQPTQMKTPGRIFPGASTQGASLEGASPEGVSIGGGQIDVKSSGATHHHR
jgi:hypothetical protein